MGFKLPCAELDELIGELESGQILLIEGLPGAGKTAFALCMVFRNAMQGYRTLYVTSNETKEKLLSMGRKLGMDLDRLGELGLLRIERLPMMRDQELVNFVTKVVVKGFDSYDIVVIDSVTPLLKLLEDYAARRAWLQSVVYDMASRSRGLLVLVADLVLSDDPDLKLLEYLADIVVELRYRCADVIERVMVFRKFRGREIAVSTIPFDIGPSGIIVLNYVAKEWISTRGEMRGIVVGCKYLEHVLPSSIEPGTSIFIADRTRNFGKTMFHQWLHIKSLEWLRNGYRIAFLSYNPRYVEIIRRYVEQWNTEDRALAKYLNPIVLSPSALIREEIRICREFGADIVFVLDIEKIFHAYRERTEHLYRYALYAINALRQLGTIAIRYFSLDEKSPIPHVYMDWSDIVIEVRREPEQGTVLIPLKTIGVREPRIIRDIDIAQCFNSIS